MIDKLQDIIHHFEELEQQMIDPTLINNQNKYKEVTREHRRLAPVIAKSKNYISVSKQIEEGESILKGDDEDLKEIVKGEIEDLKDEVVKIEDELKILLLPHDPNDDKNIILEIRAGTGGDEAALFASDLYRLYSRFAERNKWQYQVMESSPIGIGGYKELIMSINGDGAYGALKFESGVHRVQRVPKTETSGRVHTSAATVAVLPEAEEADVQIVDAELKIDTYRASGAGGQHVNKTESAIRITHLPSGIVVSQQDEKSQHKNKAKALKILRARVYEEEKRKKDKERSENRKNQIGSGDRSERIRTYNFPQGRVTDHRINLTLHKLDEFLSGEIHEEMNEGLRLKDQDLKLKGLH